MFMLPGQGNKVIVYLKLTVSSELLSLLSTHDSGWQVESQSRTSECVNCWQYSLTCGLTCTSLLTGSYRPSGSVEVQRGAMVVCVW